MSPAEHHLGDRLAALVDGELGHDARERVLAHLATCCSCKAEADAQRRVKSVFADTAPPGPSEGLLARLQGLPAEPPAAPREDDDAPGNPGAGRSGDGRPSAPFTFEYLPVARPSARGHLTPERGFRIHETERSVSRGRRFAFAAAGAFSLAALAVGGALTSQAGSGNAVASSDTRGTSAGPVRTAPAGSTARDSGRATGTTRGGGETRALAGRPSGVTAGAPSASGGLQLAAQSAEQGPGAAPAPAGLLALAGKPGVDLSAWFPQRTNAYAPPAIRTGATAAPDTTFQSVPARAQPSPTSPTGP